MTASAYSSVILFCFFDCFAFSITLFFSIALLFRLLCVTLLSAASMWCYCAILLTGNLKNDDSGPRHQSIINVKSTLQNICVELFQLTYLPIYNVEVIYNHWDCQGVNGCNFIGRVELAINYQSCPPVVFLSYFLFRGGMLDSIAT